MNIKLANAEQRLLGPKRVQNHFQEDAITLSVNLFIYYSLSVSIRFVDCIHTSTLCLIG